MRIAVSYDSGNVLFGCMEGNADEVVDAFLNGELKDQGTSICEHND